MPDDELNSQTAQAIDNRCWERHSSELSDPTDVVFVGNGRMYVAKLVDESPTGIGVLIPKYVYVMVGARVEVLFRGEQQRGNIRSVAPIENGQRVGIEFETSAA